MRPGLRWIVGMALLLLPGAARGGDDALPPPHGGSDLMDVGSPVQSLSALLPGYELTDVEMTELRGTGTPVICQPTGGGDFFQTCLPDSTLTINDSSSNQSLNTLEKSFEFADGIITVTQFTGDGNRVDVSINLEVNLNRVTIGDNNTGVDIVQSLDLGSLVGGLQNLSFTQ